MPLQLPIRRIAQSNEHPTFPYRHNSCSKHDHNKYGDPHQQEEEGYYSVFQSIHLDHICSLLTLHVHLDSYLGESLPGSCSIPMTSSAAEGTTPEYANRALRPGLRHIQGLGTIAILCQHISNRYYPLTQSNRRTFPAPTPFRTTTTSSRLSDEDWSWDGEIAGLGSQASSKKLYGLTPSNLSGAHNLLSIRQAALLIL